MKISKEIIKQIEIEAKKFFVGASGCHDWSHVERVFNLASRIGKREKADLAVLTVAALLHDIGRKEEMKSRGKFCHAEKGAELAAKILNRYQIDQKSIDNILHCIISHRYRNQNIPKTIEAKVLFDADKLDSIGAVGISRSFLFAGYLQHALYTGNEKELVKSKKDYSYTVDDTAIMEYEFKLKNIKNKILTKTGKKIAKERHNFMVAYFKRFWQEVKGLQ
ncbi:MAG: HD domain-containing protein [Candidatus Falkowbacteria bacterium]|nr:MAG: HD domain-containing protein [Candidatus Falkowbacteria bacterium]